MQTKISQEQPITDFSPDKLCSLQIHLYSNVFWDLQAQLELASAGGSRIILRQLNEAIVYLSELIHYDQANKQIVLAVHLSCHGRP